ncbi:hypothetical protein QQP08_013244 [Theobroma cacao]|nr:hypothetical protein QQP08_013244 [Theobroma cacao]
MFEQRKGCQIKLVGNGIEGRLGSTDMAIWNKACVRKQLWTVYCKSGSTWVLEEDFKTKHEIGDGRNTFFWLDNWHPHGPLLNHFSGLHKQVKVAVVVEGNGWNWFKTRSRAISVIIAAVDSIITPNPLQADTILWLPTGSSKPRG